MFHVVQLGFLLGEGDVEQVLLEIPDKLEIELALIAVQVQKNHFGVVVGTLGSLHHRNDLDFYFPPLIVLGLFVVLFLEVGSHCDQQRVDQ